MSLKGSSLVLERVKVREGRGIFMLTQFSYCNLTIKVELLLVVGPFFLNYLKELIDLEGG